MKKYIYEADFRGKFQIEISHESEAEAKELGNNILNNYLNDIQNGKIIIEINDEEVY